MNTLCVAAKLVVKSVISGTFDVLKFRLADCFNGICHSTEEVVISCDDFLSDNLADFGIPLFTISLNYIQNLPKHSGFLELVYCSIWTLEDNNHFLRCTDLAKLGDQKPFC